MMTLATPCVRFVLIFSALLISVSCGRSATIALSSEPGRNDRPNTPEKPVNPEKPPQDGAAKNNSYGVYCNISSEDGVLMKTSSLASATSPTMRIRFFEDDVDKPTDKQLLRNISGVVAGRSFEAMGEFRAQLLFQANSASGAPRIFFSEINLADKIGAAKSIAPSSALDGVAFQLAEKLGIALRNYGVSTNARYLVLPADDGRMSVWSTQPFAEIARIDLPAKNSFLPVLDEEVRTLSILQFVSGHFENRIFSIALGDRSVTLVRELKGVKPSPGYSQTPLQSWSDGKFAFSEVLPNSLSKPINLLVYDPTTESAVKSSFTPAEGASVSSWAASFESATGVLSIVVATEKMTGGKVEFASLVGVDPLTGKRVFEADYPAEVRTEIERQNSSGQKSGSLAITALQSSHDRRALFATLPKRGEKMVFKVSQDANGFSILGAGLSGCEKPVVSQEEF